MPELPDITVYIEALERRIVGQTLTRVRIGGPFVLRTATPPIHRLHCQEVFELRRLGKRIAFGFDGGLWLVLHLTESSANSLRRFSFLISESILSQGVPTFA